jgi:deferrochelatase/peroxidase EfeB
MTRNSAQIHAQQRLHYKEMDPFGYAGPLGSHARRLNPRGTAHYMNRRRMIRRGATYGPGLPEGAPDDGVDRGTSMVAQAIGTARAAGASGQILVRGDSAYGNRAVVAACVRHGARNFR